MAKAKQQRKRKFKESGRSIISDEINIPPLKIDTESCDVSAANFSDCTIPATMSLSPSARTAVNGSIILQIAPFSIVTVVEQVKFIGICVSIFKTASFVIENI